jgi:hypothetical protein
VKDGLYRVVTHFCVAGFVIHNGQLTSCAPILRKQFNRLKTQATWICP